MHYINSHFKLHLHYSLAA